MAMDADGDFVVAWTSQDQDGSSTGVYAQRYNAAGLPQGGGDRNALYFAAAPGDHQHGLFGSLRVAPDAPAAAPPAQSSGFSAIVRDGDTDGAHLFSSNADIGDVESELLSY